MNTVSAHPRTPHIIQTEAELRALIGEPAQLTCAKVSNCPNSLTRLFIERSPFICIASSDPSGNCDLSPRGDPVGFVRILDDRTLLIPERPGNRLADSLRNMLANPHIGVLFFVPGVTDTFRVNGRASITTDAELLAPSAVEGKSPLLGILVDIDEAYTSARQPRYDRFRGITATWCACQFFWQPIRLACPPAEGVLPDTAGICLAPCIAFCG